MAICWYFFHQLYYGTCININLDIYQQEYNQSYFGHSKFSVSALIIHIIIIGYTNMSVCVCVCLCVCLFVLYFQTELP